MKHIVFAIALLITSPAQGGVIYESAILGPSVIGSNVGIGPDQFLGAGFSLSEPTQITAVGGHLSGYLSTEGLPLFGAIISLPAEATLPAFHPTSLESQSLGTALVTPLDGQVSSDVRAPLLLALSPGNYALVFGSGIFGATGLGGMIDLDADIGAPFYFFSNSGLADTNWRIGGFSNTRFVVEGTAIDALIPEPATLAIFGLGLVGLTIARRRRGRELIG
jgi:hypothetical protein